MLDFKPPKDNSFVIGSVKLLLPFLMRLTTKVSHVDIDSESLDRLKSTDGYPTILVPNHPSRADPQCDVCPVKSLWLDDFGTCAHERPLTTR